MIRFYNTLTRQKEDFTPLREGEVSMYHCGPTVYDYVHIGNLRSYVVADLLRRLFENEHYTITQVINITDVGHLVSDDDDGEDKMSKALRRLNKPMTREAMYEVGSYYTEKFLEDINALNIKEPTVLPRASDHIAENIALLTILDEKGYLYKTSDGLYFDTSNNDSYGTLAQLDIAGLKEGARIEANPEKKNPTDFALWKFNDEQGWKSPWGMGFPGWHIECSAMSMKYLGETIDIHTGGIDHIPVHHTNEIAQSESATGKQFVRYWLHNEFVTVNGGKISKSEGTGITLADLIDKGISPRALRYWFLTAHYRSSINFTWEAIEGAQTTLERLYTHYQGFGSETGTLHQGYYTAFMEAVYDDLETPQAIATMWTMIKDNDIDTPTKKATLRAFDTILGLGLADLDSETTPADIQDLIKRRTTARNEKNWELADTLRTQIEDRGYTVKDTPAGQEVIKRVL